MRGQGMQGQVCRGSSERYSGGEQNLWDNLGRVRKNSGGKRQAYYQPQVTQVNAGHFFHWCL